MPTYEAELPTKTYRPNVVVLLGGQYFALREPDSGLSIPYPQRNALQSLILNPTTTNPQQVNTSISSTSFTLVDTLGVVSQLVKNTAEDLIGTDAVVYLGRSGVGMAFSDYYALPTARISKVKKQGGQYNFVTLEATELLNKAAFNTTVVMDGEIIEGTTIVRAASSIADFPDSGYLKVDDEIIYYGSKDDDLNYFTDCSRGAYGTTADTHKDASTLRYLEIAEGHPLTILLRVLISNGGGGTYDVYSGGLGISPSRIDVAGIEALRDGALADVPDFSLALYNVSSMLRVLEAEILTPLQMRFVAVGSKLSLVRLNNAAFVGDAQVLDHDTMTEAPTMEAGAQQVQNRVQVSWDYNESTGQYASVEEFTDEDSIAAYGESASPLKYTLKGVTDSAFIASFAAAVLARFAYPRPEISVKVQMDKSLLGIGDKAAVETTLLANEYGELNFAQTLEIVSRSINWQTGEVTQKLAFTAYSGLRLGFIAPSDDIAVVTSQSVVELAAGQGEFWRAGWKVRLWDRVALAYTSDATNEIASIDGDEITFVDAWSTTLDTSKHTLSFPVYREATKSQKRYAFISTDSADFSAREKAYSITP